MASVSEVSMERVLVVPTARFHQIGHFQGFSADTGNYIEALLRDENVCFLPRDQVEKDPGFKQLIPYIIFRYKDETGQDTVFQYTRGKGMGEGRLHSKRSVGIGGHISAIDVHAQNVYEEGMRRELEEEVEIGAPYKARCAGLINDDETDVGRVHLGIVHIFDMERPAVKPREDEIIESGFRPVKTILADMSAFETWSQIADRLLEEP